MIQRILQWWLDWYRGYAPLLGGVGRSSKWPQVRKEYLKLNPVCEMCGSSKTLQVHHKQPFHLHKELELDSKNFITLCGWLGHNCHFVWGHLENFKSFNVDIKQNAILLQTKIKSRP